METLIPLLVLLFWGVPLILVICIITGLFFKVWIHVLYSLLVFGLWLILAFVSYFLTLGCLSGHCVLTPLEKHGPFVFTVILFMLTLLTLYTLDKKIKLVKAEKTNQGRAKEKMG